jgi:two-component system, OmpR family, response regulator
MLVLSRRIHEKILLSGLNTAVQVLEIKRGSVRLGIDAPPEVTILRGELQDLSAAGNAAEPRARDRNPESTMPQICRQVRETVTTTAVGLGLASVQLEAGLVDDAKATLATIRQHCQLLLHGIEGELEALPAPEKVSHRARKALLVEDDSNQRELLAAFLRLSGLDVDTVGDGADALDYLRSQRRPDVVLCDMMLPRCDGPTMVRAIRRDVTYAGLKIFGVTGHPPEEFHLESGPTGIDRWFRKPLDPTELLQDLSREFDRPLCPA